MQQVCLLHYAVFLPHSDRKSLSGALSEENEPQIFLDCELKYCSKKNQTCLCLQLSWNSERNAF